MSARSNVAVRNRLEGETNSKYWIQINKAKTPRDTIQALKYPDSDPVQYEKNSERMAQIAQTYHNNLQTVGLATGEELQHTTEHALNNISRKVLPGDEQILSQPLQEEEIREALKKLALGKAAGMDGIPSELWKPLQECHETHQANEQEHNQPM